MRPPRKWQPNRIVEDLPLALFVAFNAIMAWLAWSLTTDIAYWQSLLAIGDFARVPRAEPQLSESILAGVPSFWIIGAVMTGTLAVYWRSSNAGRPVKQTAAS